MIVVDASVAVLGLLAEGEARRRLSTETLIAPHLIDSEIASALRSQVRGDVIAAAEGHRALTTWSALGVLRYPTVGLLDRMWQLRDNVSAYDATYVALAEALGCDLVTADARLSRATGPTCAITVIRA